MKPILTVIIPRTSHRHGQYEINLSTYNKLEHQFGKDYEILVFAADIPCHIIEIHQIKDVNTVDDQYLQIKKRIDKLLQSKQATKQLTKLQQFLNLFKC